MRKLTKKEIRKRVVKAVVEAMSASGMATPSEAKKVLRDISKQSSSDASSLMPPLYALMLHDHLERGVKHLVRKGCTEEQLRPVLEQVKTNAKELPTAIRKGFSEMKKAIPRHGGPGRHRILTPAQEKEACELVFLEIRIRKPLNLPNAFEEVARNFQARKVQVSAQTIKRAWGKRDLL
jgi:polyhydroxyalkanoate synthesis regulator phasin